MCRGVVCDVVGVWCSVCACVWRCSVCGDVVCVCGNVVCVCVCVDADGVGNSTVTHVVCDVVVCAGGCLCRWDQIHWFFPPASGPPVSHTTHLSDDLMPRAVALYDYTAGSSNEISFNVRMVGWGGEYDGNGMWPLMDEGGEERDGDGVRPLMG